MAVESGRRGAEAKWIGVMREPLTIAEVRQRLIGLLVEVGRIPQDMIRAGAKVSDTLHIESVDFVEIQVALEDEYQIELDPLFIIELDEFERIVDYVHRCAINGHGR